MVDALGSVLAIIIIIGGLLIIYSKIKHQSLKQSVDEVKEIIMPIKK